MNQPKIAKVVPVETDGVPHQVATEMLIEPKAKMTNRFRKNCREGRFKVYPSVAPIVDGDTELLRQTIDSPIAVLLTPNSKVYRPDAAIAPDVRMQKRVRGLLWIQLITKYSQVDHRRRRIQNKYEQVQRSTKMAEKTRQEALRVLEMAVNALDAEWNAIVDEIERRKNICKKVS